MSSEDKATRIRLFDFKSVQMRAFHMSWFAFFLCFFAWFGIAPLMKIVREEMSLSKEQIGWTIIGSVAITVVARLLIGWLCDRIGPRLAYTWLLTVCSIPVMAIGFAHDYTTFLIFRVLIGAIGASFVITQYHTTKMFASNCVGTANATSAGWGNLGGGVTQMVMPLVFAVFIGALGFSDYMGWRLSMFCAGFVCFLTGIAYYFLTQDTPKGNYAELRARGEMPARSMLKGTFLAACKDYRVWSLFLIYGACFGIELTINNIAALYFVDYFDYFKNMDTGTALSIAGGAAAAFGLMNIFARTLGGYVGDKFGTRWGLKGRVRWLFMAVFCEGLALMLFSQMTKETFADLAPWAIFAASIGTMIIFSLFVQMSEGATFSVVPFVNKNALGSVAGIVGAGGNAGAVAAGFLFKTEALSWPTALFILGLIVTSISFLAFTVRFAVTSESEARTEMEAALAERNGVYSTRSGEPVLVG